MSSVNVERINDDYEYIQYNDKLRLIHSIKDDMYQMQSIITACGSRKEARHWFDNKSTQEFLEAFDEELATCRILPVEKSWEKRDDLSNGLKGIYVHRLLVNHIAMWASSKYAIYIMELLESYFEKLRNQQEQKIEEL